MSAGTGPFKIEHDITAAMIRRGLRKHQIVPYFQPMVALRSGQLAGLEVLARWEHPDFGIIQPDNFIAVAERSGLIEMLTQHILESAFAHVSALPASLTLSVNISPLLLRVPGLPAMIRSAAERSSFHLERLVVEITESALIDNIECSLKIAQELKAMGCRISLDDFGTGYSSLLHLQALPFDELKVDRSFVGSMTQNRESRKIVAAVVGLGQSLGLHTVAEGIETQEQAEMMLWLGCELGQGWLFGRPVPAEDLKHVVSISRHKLNPEPSSPWRKVSAANLDTSPAQRLAQLQAVYDGAPVGLAFIDQNLRYVNLNRKLAEMNGALVEDHLGSKISDMVPDLFPLIESYLRLALAGDPVLELEITIPSSGQTRMISYQPALDEAGEVIGVSVAALDITERKRNEEALRESENHYRSMVELNPQVLWIMDPQGRNLDVRPRWDKSTGLMVLTEPHSGWLDAVHADDFHKTTQSVAASRRSGSPINVEYRVPTGDGGWRWMRSRGAPRFDSTGRIVCWYGSVEDIDHLKRTQDHAPRIASATASSGIHDAPPQRMFASTAPEVAPQDLLRSDRDSSRVHALYAMEILDTPPEAEFDDLVELASQICAAPISLISLLDSYRQWFKAAVGIDTFETPIGMSFCAHAIQQKGLFVVEDALEDSRFQKNPLVLGEPNIRFYAGIPLYAEADIAIGTLCVIDTVPRSLSAAQAKALAILGHQVQARLELRAERKLLAKAMAENRALMASLEEAIPMLSHAS